MNVCECVCKADVLYIYIYIYTKIFTNNYENLEDNTGFIQLSLGIVVTQESLSNSRIVILER